MVLVFSFLIAEGSRYRAVCRCGVDNEVSYFRGIVHMGSALVRSGHDTRRRSDNLLLQFAWSSLSNDIRVHDMSTTWDTEIEPVGLQTKTPCRFTPLCKFAPLSNGSLPIPKFPIYPICRV